MRKTPGSAPSHTPPNKGNLPIMTLNRHDLALRIRFRFFFAGTLCAFLWFSLISTIAVARNDPNPSLTRAELESGVPAECRTAFARRLALISIHANDPLLEDNLEFANYCGNAIVSEYRRQTRETADSTKPDAR